MLGLATHRPTPHKSVPGFGTDVRRAAVEERQINAHQEFAQAIGRIGNLGTRFKGEALILAEHIRRVKVDPEYALRISYNDLKESFAANGSRCRKGVSKCRTQKILKIEFDSALPLASASPNEAQTTNGRWWQ